MSAGTDALGDPSRGVPIPFARKLLVQIGAFVSLTIVCLALWVVRLHRRVREVPAHHDAGTMRSLRRLAGVLSAGGVTNVVTMAMATIAEYVAVSMIGSPARVSASPMDTLGRSLELSEVCRRATRVIGTIPSAAAQPRSLARVSGRLPGPDT